MVQPWSPWSQGWGRSEETQDGFRSMASIPHMTVLCMLVFPNLGTSPEDFLPLSFTKAPQKCLVAALLCSCCPGKDQSLKRTHRISGHALLFWRYLCALMSKEEKGLVALWSIFWLCCKVL